MPSLIGHSVIGYTASRLLGQQKKMNHLMILSIFCCIVPDFDTATFYFGIPYGSFFGHRGFFHSLFFCGILSLIVTRLYTGFLAFRSIGWWRFFLYFFVVTSTHPVLDALTNGGRGIALFSPFDTTRYFFVVISNELFFLILPCVLILLIRRRILDSNDE
jgi:inner membrane protein